MFLKCWTEALEQLQAGCRQLTDEMQRRIAYAFARCHLQVRVYTSFHLLPVEFLSSELYPPQECFATPNFCDLLAKLLGSASPKKQLPMFLTAIAC